MVASSACWSILLILDVLVCLIFFGSIDMNLSLVQFNCESCSPYITCVFGLTLGLIGDLVGVRNPNSYLV